MANIKRVSGVYLAIFLMIVCKLLWLHWLMMYAAVFLVFCALLPANMSQHLSDLFPQGGLCGLSTQERVDALRRIKDAAGSTFAADCSSNDFQLTLVPECGEGVWCRTVDFDVTGADMTCPAGWTFASVGCTQ